MERDDREATIRGWLSTVLGEPCARLEPASADASFRRYLRVRTAAGTRVLMDAPPGREDCRPFLALAGLLREHGVHAPEVHAAAPDLGLVLLEDLGGISFLDALPERGADALYALAIDALVRIQRLPAGALEPYDRGRLEAEMALFPEWFLERHLGVEVGAGLSALLAETGDRLVAACAEQPAVFVHRDYHSRNLMYCAEHPPGVVDFQDAVRGPISYDLVSLLRDVYLRCPRGRVEHWAGVYHRRARAAGLLDGCAPERLLRWLDLTGVQRHLKVAGIFARLWYRDGKPRYLDDVALTLEYLLEVAARHPETRELAGALADLDVLGRNARRNAGITAAGGASG